MSVTLRSHVSVRSAYFRQMVSEIQKYDEDAYVFATMADARPLWKEADKRAKEWRRAATNRYDHTTRSWSGGNPNENAGYRSAMIDAGRGHLLR